jgi:hypothetical protein
METYSREGTGLLRFVALHVFCIQFSEDWHFALATDRIVSGPVWWSSPSRPDAVARRVGSENRIHSVLEIAPGAIPY